MTALYIHIPFCKKKCAYCDFVSFAGREGDWGRYLLALEREMAHASKAHGRLEVGTVFIGGGTPSLLPTDAIMHILAMARARFFVDPDAEVTIECNPGTLSPEALRDYRDAGVNRLSMGMQAAQDELLGTLGRVHCQRDVERGVAWARAAGMRNINLDLMYGLPGQTMAAWVETVKAALALDVEHLSMYSLILEEGTPLHAAEAAGAVALPDEETTLKMRGAAARMAARRGFSRYEISNYAKEGFACRHNLTYWQRGDYLGLGCAAHSFLGGARFSNTESLEQYIGGVTEVAREQVAGAAAREEEIMLSTRLAQGVRAEIVAAAAVSRLEAMGLVRRAGNRVALTDAGMDVQNAVVLALL